MRNERDKLLRLRIISKVEELEDSVNSVVTIKKPNGSIRLCLNSKDLNQATKREHFSMQTGEMNAV